MLDTIFAKKEGMSARFTPDRERVGVTVLTVPVQKIKDVRYPEKNGYAAVRVEIDAAKDRKTIREIRTGDTPEPGTEIEIGAILKAGDRVNVSGITKGKGFAGVVKRHHFKGGPRTHGQSDRERAPGSSGSTTTPGRVFKGTRRAGHLGNIRVMVKKLKVIEVDPEKRTVVLVGAVPGPGRRGKLLTLTKTE